MKKLLRYTLMVLMAGVFLSLSSCIVLYPSGHKKPHRTVIIKNGGHRFAPPGQVKKMEKQKEYRGDDHKKKKSKGKKGHR